MTDGFEPSYCVGAATWMASLPDSLTHRKVEATASESKFLPTDSVLY